MERKRLKSSWQLKRFIALRYSPDAREDLRSIRAKYGLDRLTPVESIEWYKAQTHTSSGEPVKSTYAYLSPHVAVSMEGPFDSEIPIDRDIHVFMARYELPLRVFFDILNYIFRGNIKELPRPWDNPVIGIFYELKEMDVRLRITLDNITPWNTKEQWDAIWTEEILPFMNHWASVYGVEPPPKPVTLKSIDKELERWSEWYELAKKYGQEGALSKWRELHQEAGERFNDQSTISRALKRFKRLITPVSVENRHY